MDAVCNRLMTNVQATFYIFSICLMITLIIGKYIKHRKPDITRIHVNLLDQSYILIYNDVTAAGAVRQLFLPIHTSPSTAVSPAHAPGNISVM